MFLLLFKTFHSLSYTTISTSMALLERLPSYQMEIFDIIRYIKDPEHPQTLEDLKVVYAEGVRVEHRSRHQELNECQPSIPIPTRNVRADTISSDERLNVYVEFTPTVPHCSLATLIGLCIRVKLEQAYPGQLKLNVCVKEGTHNTAAEISKQLNDKERVAAAMENSQMKDLVMECISYA
ncbi:cytosolic iron-sulfur assembly component 2A-like [Paramacrobiotus metropolitanus]|uniref:cytosolic iron-sulfur assembly component 2A-like n=1 Tax=Paramacrobiotus metropolitanus TaxID=2943436 RepID=UPI002445CE40|nr:cytosolic iron-sulfur assembly component 2A-like [Paramacrobiotus metropolitanus]